MANVSASLADAARRRPSASPPERECLQRAGLEAAHLLRPAAPLGHPPRPYASGLVIGHVHDGQPTEPLLGLREGTVDEDQLATCSVRACCLLELLDQSAGVHQDALVLHVADDGLGRFATALEPRLIVVAAPLLVEVDEVVRHPCPPS